MGYSGSDDAEVEAAMQDLERVAARVQSAGEPPEFAGGWRDGASGAAICVSAEVSRVSFALADAVAFSMSDVQRVARCSSMEIEDGALAARTVTVSGASLTEKPTVWSARPCRGI